MNPFWWQGFLSMLVWISMGWFMRKRSFAIRAALKGWPRARLVFFGSAGFILSGALLFGALVGIAQAGWWSRNGFTALGWIAMTLAGGVFVALQVLAAASMLTIVLSPENERSRQPSKPQK